MHTLTQYLHTLENPEGLCRRLEGFELIRDTTGKPIYHIGNSAILFKIRLHNRTLRLRCYTHPMGSNLELLYGEALLRKELYLYCGTGGEWVDVVVEDWIEGKTLEQEMHEAIGAQDRHHLMILARAFERFAARLLAEEWAHGDLKPENILVSESGELRLIDFDGCYLPESNRHEAPERGTPAFQHPCRGATYDRWIDHYPAALITTQLHALALDPTLAVRTPQADGFLFLPEELLTRTGRRPPKPCACYEEVLQRFADRGDARHYRLAKILCHPTHRLPHVEELLSFENPLRNLDGAESYFDQGLAGFVTPTGKRTPLLYDEAFDFSEGWALIRIGNRRHYIDRCLRVTYTLPRACTAAKSVRNGKIRYQTEGKEWIEVIVGPSHCEM